MSADPVDRFTSELGRSLVAYAKRLTAESATVPYTRPAPHRPARGWSPASVPLRRRGLALAVVLATAVALVAAGNLLPATAPVTASAATVLRQAAAGAATQPSNALAPGEYWYVDARAVYPAWHQRYSDRTWTDQIGREVEQASGSGVRSSVQRRHGTARPFVLGSASLSYAQLRALPTAPAQLRALLQRQVAHQLPAFLRRNGFPPTLRGANGRTLLLFRMIRDAFVEPTSPELRSGLLRVAASLPFHLDGWERDHLGRAGVGLSFILAAERFRMIVAPATGRLLEMQRIVLPSGRPYWHTTGLFARYTYIAARVVPGPPRP